LQALRGREADASLRRQRFAAWRKAHVRERAERKNRTQEPICFHKL